MLEWLAAAGITLALVTVATLLIVGIGDWSGWWSL